MKILINYANAKYNPARKWNTRTGRWVAKFDKIYAFGPKNVDQSFRAEHAEIFAERRGDGLWLWKPYLINKVLADVEDGDVIFYCDSGACFVRHPQCVYDELSDDAPLFVCDIPLLESCFTKPQCFDVMRLTEERYRKSNQIIATFFCFKVSEKTRKFMAEWLSLCCNYDLLSPAGLGKFEAPDHNYEDAFVAHREDQSLFSLLCKKYGIVPHRDISQRGLKPETYRSPYYSYKVPAHPQDTYKTILFLHKSSKLDIVWLLKYMYRSIRRRWSK